MAYSEMGGILGQRTIISDRYQLLSDGKAQRRYLFDLQEDPGAQQDISSTNRAVAKFLSVALALRQAEVDAAVQEDWDAEAEGPLREGPLSEELRRELEVLGYIEGP